MQSIRHVSRLAASRAYHAPHRASSNISGGSMGRAWQDKEHAAESQYFNKRDAELLAQLATKLHAQTAVRFRKIPSIIHPRASGRIPNLPFSFHRTIY